MHSSNLKGVIPAVPTPVSDRGQPDIGRLLEFCRQLFEDGADALNITGTTGEATSLSRVQRLEIIAALGQSDLDTSRIMVGTGAAAVADAVALSRAAEEGGLVGALVLPPFYFKDPSPEGLLRYFDQIISATGPIDLYLYNFPALSGIAFTKQLVSALVSEFGERIAGLKDSSGDLAYATDIAESFPSLKIFPSNEGTLLAARSGRFAGCISATANLSVAECASAFRGGNEKALDKAKAVRAIIAKGPLVPRIKAVLAARRSDPIWANVLPPYVSLDTANAQAILDEVSGWRDNTSS